MQYEIIGTPFPVVECTLAQGEGMITEKGSMVWMSPNMDMETKGGGVGKMLSKAFSGESMFQNIYRPNNGNGLVAFGSSFPGQIMAFQITPGNEIIAQKSAFLASEMGVELSIYFQKKASAGFFGGEGFIMQKLSGNMRNWYPCSKGWKNWRESCVRSGRSAAPSILISRKPKSYWTGKDIHWKSNLMKGTRQRKS